MRALVVYYSRTNTSAHIAEEIAAPLDGDVEAIGDRARRGGPLGWLRCAYEGYFEVVVSLGIAAHDPSTYDVVVIGGPIWSNSLSSPVRSYLRRARGSFPAVAFFTTCGGSGNPRVFEQMAKECGRQPVATLTVRASERAKAPADVARFVDEIRRAVARPATVRETTAAP